MNLKVIGAKSLHINELEKKEVTFISVENEENQKETVNHHILLADVSGSMYRNIHTLREHIKLTLDALLHIPNSYVSIIKYSGHSQSKRIVSAVKCDTMSYKMSHVYDTIENELYTQSVTVISEPLEDSISIIKSLADVCDKHHIALFTDGCLVPNHWSESTERDKCFEVAKICKSQGIYLNAIGFGQYYDRYFLKELINIAGNGGVIHIDNVKDYSNVILKIIEKINSESNATIDIAVDEGDLFNLSSSQWSKKLTLTANKVFAVIGTDQLKLPADDFLTCFVINHNATPDNSDILDDFYYSLARYYLVEEDIDNYEFIVKFLGDVHLYESTQNCYSFIEKGNAVNKVTEVIEDRSKRYLKGKNPIVETAATEALCALEILQMIISDDHSELYWNTHTDYHRITQKTNSIEDSISFKRNEQSLIPITSLSIGSEKLNIGVKVKFDGMVTDSISGLEKEACIYRDYNIINGGNVNVPEIYAKLSDELYEKLKDYIVMAAHVKKIYCISLNGIKSANKRILKSMTMNEIISDLKSIANFKCEQWACNQVIKSILGDKEKVEFTGLSVDEVEIRKLLRIDENGIYQPAAVEKDNTSPFEVYPAIHMTWNVKFPEKKVKEDHLEKLEELIYSKVNKELQLDYLNKYLKWIRDNMRYLELRVNSVRIASAIMNKSPFLWDMEIEKDKTSTDKILGRNVIVGGKVKISKKVVDEDIIEQHRFVKMIKAN